MKLLSVEFRRVQYANEAKEEKPERSRQAEDSPTLTNRDWLRRALSPKLPNQEREMASDWSVFCRAMLPSRFLPGTVNMGAYYTRRYLSTGGMFRRCVSVSTNVLLSINKSAIIHHQDVPVFRKTEPLLSTKVGSRVHYTRAFGNNRRRQVGGTVRYTDLR